MDSNKLFALAGSLMLLGYAGTVLAQEIPSNTSDKTPQNTKRFNAEGSGTSLLPGIPMTLLTSEQKAAWAKSQSKLFAFRTRD